MVTLERDDVSPEQHDDFQFDPALTLFDGPWVMRRSPDVGRTVRVAGIALLICVMALIVVDATVGAGVLDWPRRVFALVLAGGASTGIFALGGRFYRSRAFHVPSGHRYSLIRADGRGDRKFAARVHARLAAGTATAETVSGDGEADGHLGVVRVRVYQCARAAEAWATIHYLAPDGPVTVWPPVPITFEQAIALTPSGNDHTVVDTNWNT